MFELCVQIQYARSETHLIEQLDKMCEKMNSYAESTDPNTGKKSYIRTSSRSGEAITLSNVAISGDIAQKLKFAVSLHELGKTREKETQKSTRRVPHFSLVSIAT